MNWLSNELIQIKEAEHSIDLLPDACWLTVILHICRIDCVSPIVYVWVYLINTMEGLQCVGMDMMTPGWLPIGGRQTRSHPSRQPRQSCGHRVLHYTVRQHHGRIGSARTHLSPMLAPWNKLYIYIWRWQFLRVDNINKTGICSYCYL